MFWKLQKLYVTYMIKIRCLNLAFLYNCYYKLIMSIRIGLTANQYDHSLAFSQEFGSLQKVLASWLFYQESWLLIKNLDFFLSRIVAFLIGITNVFFSYIYSLRTFTFFHMRKLVMWKLVTYKPNQVFFFLNNL